MDFQEHEDILGQPTLPIVPKDPGTSYFTVTKSILALLVLLGLYVVGMRIRREVLIWREKAYKLYAFLFARPSFSFFTGGMQGEQETTWHPRYRQETLQRCLRRRSKRQRREHQQPKTKTCSLKTRPTAAAGSQQQQWQPRATRPDEPLK
jgi:hypothetical protein